MSDIELLSFVLFVWAGVATGLYLDARREVRLTKKIMVHLCENKEERDRFFSGMEQVISSKGKFNA